MDPRVDQARGQHHALLSLADGTVPAAPPQLFIFHLFQAFCANTCGDVCPPWQAREPTMMVTLCRDSEVRTGRKVKGHLMIPYDLSRVFVVKDSTNEVPLSASSSLCRLA